MNDTVTTNSSFAARQARIGLNIIAVITRFAVLDESVSAARPRTCTQTAIGLIIVAIIAGFNAGMDNTIPTDGRLTCAQAPIDV